MDRGEGWRGKGRIGWYWCNGSQASGWASRSHPAPPASGATRRWLGTGRGLGSAASAGLGAEAGPLPPPPQVIAAQVSGCSGFGLMWIFHTNDLRMK